MSSLKMHEKVIFEKLFNRGGYVLDFNNSTFTEFFKEHNIDIEAEKYLYNGTSKMKRLRAFWSVEPDYIVGKVLEALLVYACSIETVAPNDKIKANKIIRRLKGEKQEEKIEQKKEDEFLKQEFKDISIHKLNLDSAIKEIIEQRMKEIKNCLESKSPLAVIFLCGSTLEGILLSVVSNNITLFNSAKTSPKDKKGKVLKIHNWTLSNLIDAAKETGFLTEDVKRFSHELRNFRNYIHPHQQASQSFNPDKNTAKICFQVLKAAIHQITKKLHLMDR